MAGIITIINKIRTCLFRGRCSLQYSYTYYSYREIRYIVKYNLKINKIPSYIQSIYISFDKLYE